MAKGLGIVQPIPPFAHPAALAQRIWAHPLEHADQARDLVRRLAMEQGRTLSQAREAVE